MLHKESAWLEGFLCAEGSLSSPPSSRRRMLSVLWIWTPSLLARACSNAVFPAVGEDTRMKTVLHLETLTPEAAPCSLQEHLEGHTDRFCRLR